MRLKLLLAAALALVALAATSTAASAAYFEIQNPGEFTTTSSGKITFSAAGFITIRCDLTLIGETEGGLIEKVSGAKFGEITDVQIDNCEGGSVTEVLTPFDLVYSSIEGTLPNAVTAINFAVANAGFKLRGPGGLECLYAGAVFARTAVSGSNPYTTTGNVPITGDNIGGGSGICAILPGDMAGTFNPITPPIEILRL